MKESGIGYWLWLLPRIPVLIIFFLLGFIYLVLWKIAFKTEEFIDIERNK